MVTKRLAHAALLLLGTATLAGRSALAQTPAPATSTPPPPRPAAPPGKSTASAPAPALPASPAPGVPAATATPAAEPAASADGATTPPPPPAQKPPAPSRAAPRLHHPPRSVARAHRALTVTASIEHPELVKRAVLVYRTSARAVPREVAFRRGVPADYVAEIPKGELTPPWLEYTIELEALDGTRSAVFATRADMHRVHVPDDLDDARERALDERLSGRRSVFFASGEYVNFGTSVVNDGEAGDVRVRDNYFRIEGGYTYRPLRFVAEFSLRAGIVRGRSPVPFSERTAPGKDPDERFDVGLNYGAPTVRLRLHDFTHLEAELLTSVTEVGFSAGTGAALLLGDPYGSKLTLGFETIKTFGTRFFSRMDVIATRAVRLAPVIEITNMPHADDYGVRLIGEVDVEVAGGFGFSLRGGYQARVFTEGGFGAGLGARYAF